MLSLEKPLHLLPFSIRLTFGLQQNGHGDKPSDHGDGTPHGQ